MRYLSAHYIFPVSSPPLRNGIICVNNDGCIVDVIDTGGKVEEREKLEFYNGILAPGFVNAHCHLELSHLRGSIEPNIGLPGFISSVGQMRRADAESIVAAAKAADEEMTRNGIVAVGDISNSADTLNVKCNSRMRYHTFIELFGLDGNRSQEIFTAAQQVKQKYDSAGLSASIVPHAIYSVSQELWKLLHQSYQTSPPKVTSIHHHESGEEMNIYLEGKGELADMFRKNGLLTDGHILSRDVLLQMMNCLREASRCLLVHNTFSTKEDLIRYQGTSKNSQRHAELVSASPQIQEIAGHARNDGSVTKGVFRSPHQSLPGQFYFVLCPKSNLFIQNRLPDLLLFSSQELHQNICLGTDSLASNTKLSILEEIKIIQQHAPDIPLDMLLQWATLNGARALDFEHFCGSFEKGKTPGVNLITGIDFDRMLLTAESIVKKLY